MSSVRLIMYRGYLSLVLNLSAVSLSVSSIISDFSLVITSIYRCVKSAWLSIALAMMKFMNMMQNIRRTIRKMPRNIVRSAGFSIE